MSRMYTVDNLKNITRENIQLFTNKIIAVAHKVYRRKLKFVGTSTPLLLPSRGTRKASRSSNDLQFTFPEISFTNPARHEAFFGWISHAYHIPGAMHFEGSLQLDIHHRKQKT